VKLAAAECGSHFLFGSSSLPGADHRQHLPALVWAWRNFPAPPSWRPGPRARDIVDARDHGDVTGNPAGLSQLLRFYLSAGARVSTHAVLDRDLGTTHLFTGLELPSGRI
jgi:putative hemolysin